MRLNNEQQIAVNHDKGPMMVIAGAGSGKTRVLTNRIVNLIEKGTSPYSILAVTFTNKAAKEMKDRVIRSLEHKFVTPHEMWVSTFHSICVRILKRDIEKIGFNKNFTIVDSDDSKMIIKRIIKNDLKLDTKEYTPQYMHNHISKMMLQEDPKFYLRELNGKIRELIENAYIKYTEYKKINNILDFDDLIVKTIELLESSDEILEYYHNKFRYILVDEFQDTNNIQFKLIDLLCNKERNIFIVGDMDQSIYSFRGANYENINRFVKEYRPQVIKLEQNYRSTKRILDAANSVITRNENRIDKQLRTENFDGDKITYYTAYNHHDEATFVRKQIELHVRNGASYSDFAVLYRMNAMSRVIEQQFSQYRIPYKVYGGMSFFDRMEIKDIVAYLKLILEPNDNWSFQRVINTPKRSIGPAAVEKLYNLALEKEMSMFEAIDLAASVFSKAVYTKFLEFKQMIYSFRDDLALSTLSDFITLVIAKTGYNDYMISLGEEGKTRLEYLDELKSLATDAEKFAAEKFQSKAETLDEMLTNITLRDDQEQEQSNDRVVLMSIHAAKGLEFPYVFIVGMENGIFPAWGNLEDNVALEEERRLCYVAMTRAEHKLFLSNAIERVQYGQTKFNPPSQFISEIDVNTMEQAGVRTLTRYNEVMREANMKPTVLTLKQPAALKIDSFLKKEDVSFNAGDKINHTVFGNGVVISVEGEFMKIAFEIPHGIKTLMKNHTAISKL